MNGAQPPPIAITMILGEATVRRGFSVSRRIFALWGA
jgi:hypothetical protein